MMCIGVRMAVSERQAMRTPADVVVASICRRVSSRSVRKPQRRLVSRRKGEEGRCIRGCLVVIRLIMRALGAASACVVRPGVVRRRMRIEGGL